MTKLRPNISIISIYINGLNSPNIRKRFSIWLMKLRSNYKLYLRKRSRTKSERLKIKELAKVY